MKSLTADQIYEIYKKNFEDDNSFSKYILRDGAQELMSLLIEELEE